MSIVRSWVVAVPCLLLVAALADAQTPPPAPTTPVPTTPAPATPAPATPMPTTPAPATPAPAPGQAPPPPVITGPGARGVLDRVRGKALTQDEAVGIAL